MYAIYRNKKRLILDEYCGSGFLRVKVLVCCNISEIKDQFFERRNLRAQDLIRYYRELGFKNVCRKFIQRLRERETNTRYLSFGYGVVAEGAEEGKSGFFVATSHPKCFDSVVLPSSLFLAANWLNVEGADHVLHVSDEHSRGLIDKGFKKLMGWNFHSGVPQPDFSWVVVRKVVEESVAIAEQTLVTTGVANYGKVVTRGIGRTEKDVANRLKVSVVGFGHYARTVVLPNLPSIAVLNSVYDIQPDRLLRLSDNIGQSTLPYISAEDESKVIIVSCYHHMHASVALRALDLGKKVIVEKPLVTSRDQLEMLEKSDTSSLYVGFNRRYSPFNRYIFKDLSIAHGEAIDCDAYIQQESLPNNHWYNWPVSGGPIVSNGCHWIDYFLYLNNDCDVVECDASVNEFNQVEINLALVNGAIFNAVLHRRKSTDIGIREHVNLSNRDSFLTIRDSYEYVAYKGDRLKRKLKFKRNDAYKNMYQYFFSKIASGGGNESWWEIRKSAELVLQLDEMVKSKV